MGRINYGRVLIGGLLAGAVIAVGESILNALLLVDQWRGYFAEHALPNQGVAVVAMYILLCFVIGVAMVLLYALIRPRCGAGPKTAVQTGLFVWFLLWFANFGIAGIAFGIPMSLILITLAWGLVEVCLASLAGAWVYREEPLATHSI